MTYIESWVPWSYFLTYEPFQPVPHRTKKAINKAVRNKSDAVPRGTKHRGAEIDKINQNNKKTRRTDGTWSSHRGVDIQAGKGLEMKNAQQEPKSKLQRYCTSPGGEWVERRTVEGAQDVEQDCSNWRSRGGHSQYANVCVGQYHSGMTSYKFCGIGPVDRKSEKEKIRRIIDSKRTKTVKGNASR